MSTQEEKDIHLLATPVRIVGEWIKILILLACLPFFCLFTLVYQLFTGASLAGTDLLWLMNGLLIILSPWIVSLSYLAYKAYVRKKGENDSHEMVFSWFLFICTAIGMFTLTRFMDCFSLPAWFVEGVWVTLILGPIVVFFLKAVGCFVPHPEKFENKHLTTTFWGREIRKMARRRRDHANFRRIIKEGETVRRGDNLTDGDSQCPTVSPISTEPELEEPEWKKLGKQFVQFARRDDGWAWYLRPTVIERDPFRCLLGDSIAILKTFCYTQWDQTTFSLSLADFVGQFPGFQGSWVVLKDRAHSEFAGKVLLPKSLEAAARCDAVTGSRTAVGLADLFSKWITAVTEELSSESRESCRGHVAAYHKALESMAHPPRVYPQHGDSDAMEDRSTTLDEDCQLLGVDEYYTIDELSAARRQKVAQWHTDRLEGITAVQDRR
jgi:hypothetical protein